ncbi:MAG: hypothetical protein HDQ91_00480 [Desulfovibrio sp.]|nr:hypothetical protein [Desulfovibrio sp.]
MILENQVYGLAPTDIIYRIATNYILGFDDGIKSLNRNFRIVDAIAEARAGKLEEVVAREFGD